MSFNTPCVVQFKDTDAAGVVYFARVFEYFHGCFEGLLRAMGCPIEVILNAEDWITPIVHAEADYKAPMTSGDLLVITPSLKAMGTTSFTLAYRITNQGDGRLHATGHHVHVVLDKAAHRPRPIPQALRAGFEALGLSEAM